MRKTLSFLYVEIVHQKFKAKLCALPPLGAGGLVTQYGVHNTQFWVRRKLLQGSSRRHSLPEANVHTYPMYVHGYPGTYSGSNVLCWGFWKTSMTTE